MFVLLYLPAETTQAAEAEDSYYIWVDENGVTNYARQSPKGYESTYVSKSRRFGQVNRPREKTKSPEAPAGSATAKPEVNPEIEIQEERADIQEQIARIRASNCDIGKRNLAKLESYARIRVKGDDGEERVLTEEEKQARTAKARKTISENCVGG